jgi:endonuclease YncB( thermonuclease family)
MRNVGAFWLVVGLAAVAVEIAGCEAFKQWEGRGGDLASGDSVRLTQIVKGDELEVERGGTRYRVRMLGIQAFYPVLADTAFLDKYSKAAEAALAAHKGRDVQLFFEAPVKDVHGRYLAYVQTGDTDLNLEMIRQGLVIAYTEFAFGREQAYLDAEATGRRERRGLWEADQALPTISGLRKQWRELRRGRSEKPPADPLL